jgi:ubiquinone/menaquinone biosynthesis C-methylase UbiE
MTKKINSEELNPSEIQSYYEGGHEQARLASGPFQVERARTEELLTRFLPSPPAVILDIGGGPGAYALWLSAKGYEVHLIDPVPLHVEQALEASGTCPLHPIASVSLGDARKLERPDASADAVLLLGPLYHLTERRDRIAAWSEAHRVLRPEGVVLAVGISRFASTLDGLFRGLLKDPEFARIVERDLVDGQHRNPNNHPEYFTKAFFHLPEDLRAEAEEAGLHVEKTLAVEGPAWLLQDFEQHWKDPVRREHLLNAVRSIEEQPALLGASAHLLIVARKTRR